MTRIMFKPFLVAFLSVLIFLYHSLGFAIEPSIEDALLKEDWQGVIEIIEKDDSKVNDPIARLIMGHASLSTNHNNESMLLFLSVKKNKDIELWSEWTDLLFGKHSQNHIALYLKADATARIGKLLEAEELFTKAIEVKKDFALAYNARGVVRVFTDKWDNALIDFYQATNLAPNLSEVHASLGNYWVLNETPDGALGSFNKALKINPNFAIAYNGRGAAYFGKGEFEKSANDFMRASDFNPLLAIAEINYGFASSYASTFLITLANMQENPGTTLQSRFELQQAAIGKRHKELIRQLPSQSAWKKFNSIPKLSFKNQQMFSDKFGRNALQIAISAKMTAIAEKMVETNQQMQKLNDTIGHLGQASIMLGTADTIISLSSAKNELLKLSGWKKILGDGSIEVSKSFVSSKLERPLDKITFDLITSGPVSASFSAGQAIVDKAHSSAISESQSLHNKSIQYASEYRILQNRLLASGVNVIKHEVKHSTPSTVPAYQISTNRPLLDLSSLSSSLNNLKKSPLESTITHESKTVMIVSQNPFRTSQLQSELNRHGIETNVVQQTTNVQLDAKHLSSYAAVKIGRPEPLIQRRRDSLPRNPDIPYPGSGGGQPPGGGASIPTFEPQRQPKLNNNVWNKFAPIPTKMPGGVSTKEIANAFVDKGNWPVMTTFGLLYNVAQNDTRSKQE